MRPRYCLLLLMLATGCGPLDPFERPYTWSSSDNNDANLRVMVVNPSDLAAGVDRPGSLSAEATRPVVRLLSGRRAPLSVSNASQIGNGRDGGTDPSAQPPIGQLQ